MEGPLQVGVHGSACSVYRVTESGGEDGHVPPWEAMCRCMLVLMPFRAIGTDIERMIR